MYNYNGTFGTVGNKDLIAPHSWIFEIPEYHREIIFKYATFGTVVEDANVPDLPNLRVFNNIGSSVLTIPAGHASAKTLLKITYYPFFGAAEDATWIAENINYVTGISVG